MSRPIKRTVEWNRATRNRYGNAIRTSKCGNYVIETHRCFSSANAMHDRQYSVHYAATGERVGSSFPGCLEDAKILADRDYDRVEAARFRAQMRALRAKIAASR